MGACGCPRESPATQSQPGCGSDASHHTWGWAGSQAHRRLGKGRPSVGIREGWRGTGGKHLVAASLSFFFLSIQQSRARLAWSPAAVGCG